MSGELRAIETIYHGFRFRSRLEARWAVFFHELGVPFQYEVEGYELGDGLRYLPDFVLPTWDVFGEVKPELPSPAELQKARALVRVAERPVLFLIGQPWPGDGGFQWIEATREHLSDRWLANMIGECRKCDGYCLVDWDFRANCMQGWSDIGPHSCGSHEKDPLIAGDLAPRVWAAYRAARGARFEFGEQG